MRNKLQCLLNLLIPAQCLLCQVALSDSQHLCQGCHSDLPWLTHVCERCSSPVTSTDKQCASCLIHPPPYSRLIALWHYEQPITRLITGMKFFQQYAYLTCLSDQLAIAMKQYYQDEPPECIVPVPLHSKRLRQRGFNQAYHLAKRASQALAIPIENDLCQRIKATQPQARTPYRQRQKNLRSAFISRSHQYRHIAVIDDVITTGATVQSLCQSLDREHLQIDVWCCARASK